MENDNTYKPRAKKSFLERQREKGHNNFPGEREGTNQPSLTGFPSGPKPRKGKH